MSMYHRQIATNKSSKSFKNKSKGSLGGYNAGSGYDDGDDNDYYYKKEKKVKPINNKIEIDFEVGCNWYLKLDDYNICITDLLQLKETDITTNGIYSTVEGLEQYQDVELFRDKEHISIYEIEDLDILVASEYTDSCNCRVLLHGQNAHSCKLNAILSRRFG